MLLVNDVSSSWLLLLFGIVTRSSMTLSIDKVGALVVELLFDEFAVTVLVEASDIVFVLNVLLWVVFTACNYSVENQFKNVVCGAKARPWFWRHQNRGSLDITTKKFKVPFLHKTKYLGET